MSCQAECKMHYLLLLMHRPSCADETILVWLLCYETKGCTIYRSRPDQQCFECYFTLASVGCSPSCPSSLVIPRSVNSRSSLWNPAMIPRWPSSSIAVIETNTRQKLSDHYWNKRLSVGLRHCLHCVCLADDVLLC